MPLRSFPHPHAILVKGGGRPSPHVVDLRQRDHTVPGHNAIVAVRAVDPTNFLHATLHERSWRLAAVLTERGWNRGMVARFFIQSLVSCLKTGESVYGALQIRRHFPSCSTSTLRAAGAFFVIAFVIILPLKVAFSAPGIMETLRRRVLARGFVAMDALERGGTALLSGEFSGAKIAFAQAEDAFTELDTSLGILGQHAAGVIGTLPVVGKHVGTPLALIEVGKFITLGSEEFSHGLELLVHTFGASVDGGRAEEAITHFRLAHEHLAAALEAFARVDSSIVPENLQQHVALLEEELRTIVPLLERVPERVALVETLLGYQRRMRYLIVFENNAELRPAGGFAGSFALLDVDRGKLVGLEITGGGTYDVRGSLPLRLAAPEPLQRLRQRWEFQDVNWFSDWPTSAATLIAFYERSGGPTVDGAIAITTTALEELLKVIGPVTLANGSIVDAESAFMVIQSDVESSAARKTKKPKALIAGLAPRILERLFSVPLKNVRVFLPSLERIVRERHIQAYLKDSQLERTIIDAGVGGEMRDNTGGDFLAIVRSNIGGGKSDRVLEDQTEVTLTVGADGTLVQTVKLRRTHRGIVGTPFVGVPNISYVRAYVPDGSVLKAARGFTSALALMEKTATEDEQAAPLGADLRVQERAGIGTVDPESRTRVTREFGKTVFGNWVVVDPGQTVDVELVYTLPFTLATPESMGRYTLLIEKQAGTVGETLAFRAVLPEGWDALWSTPEGVVRSGVTLPLDRDRVIGILFTRRSK